MDGSEGAETVRIAMENADDQSYQIEWARSCADGLERLVSEVKFERPESERLVAVLVDLDLPDSQGIEVFSQLFRVAPHIPFLILSSLRDEEIAKRAVQSGAQDYLRKEYLTNYLLPKAVHSMGERAAISEALFE